MKVGDINIYYEIHGDGPPLVMIMGLSANKDWWHPFVLDQFSKNFKTVIFDNRGAGRTDKPKIDYSIKMFAEDTIGLMDKLGIKKSHILGVSMGGIIAQEIALTHPERVDKLVLVSTSCGGPKSVPVPPETLKIMLSRGEMTDEERMRTTVDLLYPEEYRKNNPEIIEEAVRRLMIAPIPIDAYMRQLQAASQFDSYDRLPMIKAPTIVLTGKKDVLLPWENSKILAERISKAKLVTFEESGHGMVSQNAEEFAQKVIEFLKS
ncbi:MAG: alpha/beta fold hydrolase [Candidatus Jordarchaeum sp.]|uniref:alpha/beta fold hydrolase n=1 Tax=Candidatus Jordarchaeum sp. TaxID=2823881 RepID=UPI00404A5F76